MPFQFRLNCPEASFSVESVIQNANLVTESSEFCIHNKWPDCLHPRLSGELDFSNDVEPVRIPIIVSVWKLITLHCQVQRPEQEVGRLSHSHSTSGTPSSASDLPRLTGVKGR